MNKWFSRFIVSLVGAFVIEGPLTILTSLLPASNGAYGAPLTVGISKGIQLNIFMNATFSPQPPTFDAFAFAANIFLTTIFFLLIARWCGLMGCVIAIIGVIVSGVVSLYISGQMQTGTMFFDRMPFPIFNIGRNAVNGIALWINTMVIALIFAMVWQGSRTLLRRCQSGQNGR